MAALSAGIIVQVGQVTNTKSGTPLAITARVLAFVVSLSNRERPLAAERSPFDPAAAAGLRANEGTHVAVVATESTETELTDRIETQ